MASTAFSVFVLLATIHVVAAACGNQCKFRFCKLDGTDAVSPKGGTIALRAPRTSITQYICRSFGTDEELTKITGTGEATVDGTKISKLSIPFKKSYLRVRSIDFAKGAAPLQGISREKTTKEQNDFFLTRKCVVLPITKFDVRNKDTGVIRSVASNNPVDCVAFQARARRLTVEAVWDNEDDFDLSVKGPSGTGFAANDNIVGRCGDASPPPVGKETVVYTDPEPGDYKVILRHFNACDSSRKTKYTVRVTLDGKTLVTRNGKSDLGKNRIVLKLKFKVPA